jgi:hypothetical protein
MRKAVFSKTGFVLYGDPFDELWERKGLLEELGLNPNSKLYKTLPYYFMDARAFPDIRLTAYWDGKLNKKEFEAKLREFGFEILEADEKH